MYTQYVFSELLKGNNWPVLYNSRDDIVTDEYGYSVLESLENVNFFYKSRKRKDGKIQISKKKLKKLSKKSKTPVAVL